MKTITEKPTRGTGRRAVASTGKDFRRAERSTPVIDLVPALLKIKSILVPIDFSANSEKALTYAVAFAEQFGARITLLNVVEPIVVPEYASSMMSEHDKWLKSAKAKLDALWKQKATNPRTVGRTLARFGTPFNETCRAASNLKADLIIIATHGHTGLKHALLGSTAERVIRHAPCPVLVVREREQEFV